MANVLDQADQFALIGGQLQVPRRKGSAEEGDGAGALLKNRAEARARRVTIDAERALEV